MVRRPPQKGEPQWSDDEATRADPNAAKLSLVARAGPITLGTVFGSDGAPITIGRGAGCAIVLPIAESSRRHSRIEYRGGRFWITDLDTLNGTRVNGELVREPVVIEDEDVVDICGQQFQVRLGILKGRKVVYDGFDALEVAKEIETEPLAVGGTPAWLQKAPPALQGARVHPALIGLVVMLSALVATGMALLVVSRMGRGPLAQPQPPAAVATSVTAQNANVNPSATPAPTGPRPTAIPQLLAVEIVIVPSYANGVVKEIVPRGTPVSAHETVADLEDGSLERKRKEYEKLKERFGDNDDYAEFIEEARLDLEKVHLTHIQTPAGGVVISTAVADGQRIHRGDEVARVASRLELRLDASAVSGAGPSCRVTLKPGAIVDGTLSPGTDGNLRSIQVGRLPPEIEPGPLPDAHAACDAR